MLDLGVTPSHVSLQEGLENVEENDGEEEEEQQAAGEGREAAASGRSYCIPLLSLGLGGNKITCLGAGSLADGLKSNTSELICSM